VHDGGVAGEVDVEGARVQRANGGHVFAEAHRRLQTEGTSWPSPGAHAAPERDHCRPSPSDARKTPVRHMHSR